MGRPLPSPRIVATALIVAGLVGALVLPRLSFPFLTFTKLLWLASVVMVWAGVVVLGWRARRLRLALLALPLGVWLVLALPARPVDRSAILSLYVEELKSFEGTPYVWGGENRRGIDCSGLPRRALRNALLRYGFRHGNSRAIRLAASQWWFDASAQSLAAGHRQSTVPLDLSGPIPSLAPELIQPGDLAITHSGAHLLVALGGTQWIQADPGQAKVITLDATTSTNGWLRPPVTLHRWSLLQPPP